MEPIHEYVLYTDAIKVCTHNSLSVQRLTLRLNTNFILTVVHAQSTLKHRDTIHMEYEVTLEELSRKKAEKEEVQI